MAFLPMFVTLLTVRLLIAQVKAGVTLTVSPTGGNASSPYLYGIMFEVCESIN